ncbi:MAG: hypothetical protein IKS39_09810 [Clostridia bacterium]|nr:hypothetical protein [Clostridia bacterium]
MKKVLALTGAIIIIVSLCSCSLKPSYKGGGSQENNGVDFDSSFEKYEKDFSLPDGETVARLEVTYPVIKCEESRIVEQQINNWFKMYLREEEDIIETNLQHTDDYKEKYDIDGVTVTIINCEEYDRSPTAVSYLITKKTGINPDNETGTTIGRSFSLANGKQLRLSDLYAPGAEEPEKAVRQAIHDEADISYSIRGGIPLSEEQHEILDGLFDENDFCLSSSDDIVFPYSFDILSKGARQGTYLCAFNIYSVYDAIITPDDYYQSIVNPVVDV